MWIGHDKGLSKYDGYRFIHYQNASQKGRPLSNLMQDDEGKIWCQNFVGQFFFVERDTLKICPILEPIGFYSPGSIVKGNTLITAGKNGLRYLDTKHFKLKENVLKNFNSNHYTFATDELYYYFNKNEGKLFVSNDKEVIEVQDAPFHTNYFFVIPTKNTTYYLPKYPDKKLNLINWKNKEVNFTFPPKTFVQNVRILKDSLIAINTSNGIYLFNQEFTPVKSVGQHFFTTKNTSTITLDREGNWWVGTLNEGILFIPNMYLIRSFENISITAIATNKKDQALLLGTSNNQLLKYSLKDKSLKTVFSNPLNQEITSISYDSASEDIAYASDNLYIYPKYQTPIVHDGAFKDIHKLDNQHYITAASGFVGMYSRDNRPLKNLWQKAYKNTGAFENIDSSEFRLNNNEIRVRALALLKDTIIAATTGGLIAYTLKGPQEITYEEKSIIASDLETYNNTLFVASFNDGLLVLENGRLKKLFSPDRSSVTGIYKLKISKGTIWMLTETYLIAYDIKTRKSSIINQADGLPMDDLRDFSIMNDTIYIVGNKGLMHFPAVAKVESNYKPILIINSFKVNQVEKGNTFPISLKSNENDIAINYSVIAYRAGADVKVGYRINESEWKLLEVNTRQLRLASLAPDAYTLEMRAFSDGVSTIKPTQISFTIHKPFYQKVWFILLCLVLIFSCIYLLYQQRLAKIKYQNKLETDRLQLEQELQQSLLASIKAQMNPHFIYNSLSSIHSFVYSDDKENAIKYLDSFSELTRKILELSNHDSILLSEEIELLQTYISIEKMRFGETFTSNINCAPDIDIHFVKLPSMIIQPFVENAIKHGLLHRKGHKQLHITFSKKENDLIITIEDNGVGRKTSHELKSNRNKNHSSFSISANKKRLELLNAKKKNTIGLKIIDKTDEMGRGTGTMVVINIPTQFS